MISTGDLNIRRNYVKSNLMYQLKIDKESKTRIDRIMDNNPDIVGENQESGML